MRSSGMLSAGIVLLVSAAVMALLHGCQDTPEPTEPEPAVTLVRKTLTVSGSGSGSGVVTSSPTGINCTITAGVAATTGCSAQFTQGAAVTLTAVPKSGHSFKAWFGACTGTGACKVWMTVNRSVTARFLKGPFNIKISSASAGVGSGKVTSQPGLIPAINCVITNGTPASTGCAAKYPAYTQLTLTATPSAGFVFSGWGGPCRGTGTCQYSVIQSVTISATFTPSGSSLSAIEGRWAAPIPTSLVAIHMHQLPTGKVLLWGHQGDAQLWDPANPGAGFTPVNLPYEVFCSGHAFLPDGRLFVAGGHISNNHGLPMGTIFDPISGNWSATQLPMARGRWYPTTTVLPNGEVLVVAGADENGAMVTVPEIWNGSEWRLLTTASLKLPYYPPMFVAPNGKVFLAGDESTTRYLDVGGTGEWSTVGERKV